ncbi:MAG: peroxiredoxin family protein [Dehalococcoidia bacterium]|nr:peroxiredoxin family protein [Dehalococcoidia bacterium]
MTAPEDGAAAIPAARRYPTAGAFPTGPGIGEAFPAAALHDQHGEPVHLPDAAGGRQALVVFHRSARWCAFCRTQLLHLQQHLPAFEAAGVALFAVSYDSVPTLAEFAGEHGITYPLLSDEGSHLIRRLGILNDLVRPDEDVYGIPYPGAYALSASGHVLRKYFYRHYRDRPSPLGVLREAFGAEVDLSACAGAEVVQGGRRVTAQLADRVLVPHQHTPLYVQVTPAVACEVQVTGEGLEVGVPLPVPAPGVTGFTVPLLLPSLEQDNVEVTVTVAPVGQSPVHLALRLAVPGLNRSTPAR